MKKFPVVVTWTVQKVVFIDAHSEAGALDKAQDEQPDNGEVVEGSMEANILVVK
jgi:hypothetical protein